MKKIILICFILFLGMNNIFAQIRVSALIHGNNQNLWNNSTEKVGGFGFGASMYFKRSKNFWIGAELNNYKIGESSETAQPIIYPAYSSYASNYLHKEGRMYTASVGFEHYFLPTKIISPYIGANAGLAVLNIQPYTENFRGELIPIVSNEKQTSHGLISAFKLGVLAEVKNTIGLLGQISFQPITGTDLKTNGLWNIKFGLTYRFKN